MKIKFLSIIASFFMVSLVITSCLGDDEDIEYSPDATIRAFELDTIGYGIKYKFTIDQLRGEIYNEDSLPVRADTIIDRILIKTLTTASGIVTMKDKLDQDSIINIADSIDLRKYINAPEENKPLELKVFAPDMQSSKIYKLSIRKHNQDPDSLNWGNAKDVKPTPFKSGFSEGNVIGKQKAVIFEENILVYYLANNKLAAYKTYKAATSYGKTWESVNDIQGIEGVKATDLSSIIEYNGYLYMVANNKIYWSNDGSDWKLHQVLNRNDLTFATLLIGVQPDTETTNVRNAGISAIVSADGGSNYHFYMTDENAMLWSKPGDRISPEFFPTRNISSTISFSATGVPFIVSMGTIVLRENDEEDEDTEETPKPIVPWSSYDGLSWIDLSTNSGYCPMLNFPSVITYNESLYAFGNDFGKFYISPSGLTWKEANKKFYFPKLLTERAGANYSIVIDKEQFIWIICSSSKGTTGGDDVWRGRLNKLGFEKQ